MQLCGSDAISHSSLLHKNAKSAGAGVWYRQDLFHELIDTSLHAATGDSKRRLCSVVYLFTNDLERPRTTWHRIAMVTAVTLYNLQGEIWILPVLELPPQNFHFQLGRAMF